jgi:polar amino acid transport system permease protein/cystine transport system permease protein
LSAWLSVLDMLPLLLIGAITTVEVTVGGFIIAVLIGLTCAILQGFRSRLLRAAVAVYVDVFRAVPVLTQLFIIYFGLTEIGIRLDPVPAAIVGFGINGGAYLTEVFRGGIASVHAGQMEAAQMLGMTRLAAMRIVILPQAMRVVLPPLANYAIALLKETSIASLIAAPELTNRARDLSSEYFMPMEIYLVTGAIYFVMAFPLSRAARLLERRMARGR